jgi:hypothetical protein
MARTFLLLLLLLLLHRNPLEPMVGRVATVVLRVVHVYMLLTVR